MNELATALHSLLAHNIVSFTFRKVNGEIRHAKGTRNLDLARNTTGEYIPNPKGAEQPNSYYDVQSNGWRSYKPENLISIDGVCDASGFYTKVHPTEKDELPKREIPVLNGKPFSKLSENDKGVVAGLETEMPSHTENFPMSEILKGLFGGAGFGGGFAPKYHDEEPVKESVGVPVGAVPVEDFAKMIAHYVVVELVEKLTR